MELENEPSEEIPLVNHQALVAYEKMKSDEFNRIYLEMI